MSVRPAASPLSNNDKPLPLPLPSPSPAAGATTTSRHSYTSKSSNSPSSAFQGLPSNLAMDNNTSSSSSLPAGRNSMGNLGTGTGAGGTGGLSPSSTSNNPPPNSNAARFRASVDAARTLYGTSSSSNNNNNGHQSLQPGSAAANSLSISSASNSPRPASGLGSKRPSSEMLASFAAGGAMNSESDALDKWFEDLHHYEATLEEMAAASLDQSFKEELGAIEQWFRVLSEAERTAALYSLLQTSSQVQIRFFITVLQQMARSDPMNALLSPANPQQASMEAQMDAKLASLGLKSPASPAVRQFARQSLGAMPMGDSAGFLSPNSAMLQPPPRGSSTSTGNIDNTSASDSADAATLLAAQRARLNAHAANRISAPGSLLSAYDTTGASLRSPLWSQANSEQVAERSGRSPSPDGRSSNASRSRPASMISDQGLPSASAAAAAANNNSNSGNNNTLSPSMGAAGQRNVSGTSNLGLDSITSAMNNLENGALSPLMQGQSWAAMMNTPLMSSFGPNNLANAEGTFPRLDASLNNNNNNNNGNNNRQGGAAGGNANNNNNNNNTWSAGAASNNIVLDDAKKFRRTGRASDAGYDAYGGLGGGGMRSVSPSAGGNQHNAAMAAQQNWRNMNSSGNAGQSGVGGGVGMQPNTAGLASPDLSNLATLQAAMQQMSGLNGANGLASPQMAMANLLAAQQQIQQQMQLQQLMAGMSPMNMMNTLQQQQMLSPVLGGMGLGMMPHSANSSRDRRSPRPSDRSTMGNSSNKSGTNQVAPGSGTNPDEPLDFNLLGDIPAWLRSLRLHKYTSNFENSIWKEMILMTNQDLEDKGVAALGARRKLLKVFENIRNIQGIPHPPGSEVPGEDGKPEAAGAGAAA